MRECVEVVRAKTDRDAPGDDVLVRVDMHSLRTRKVERLLVDPAKAVEMSGQTDPKPLKERFSEIESADIKLIAWAPIA